MHIHRFISLILILPLFIAACSKKTDVDISAETSTTTTDSSPTAMTGPQDGTHAAANTLNDQDKAFVATALGANKGEVDLSSLALSKSKTQNVREFALMMAADHSAALNELVQIATSKALPIDTAATTEQADIKKKLSGLSGKQFDKEYMAVMVKDHEKARDLFQLEATSGGDTEIKAYAQKYLEGITKHLQHAREMDTTAVTAAR